MCVKCLYVFVGYVFVVGFGVNLIGDVVFVCFVWFFLVCCCEDFGVVFCVEVVVLV